MSTDERQRVERDIEVYTVAISALLNIMRCSPHPDQLQAAKQLPDLIALRGALEDELQFAAPETGR